MLQDQRLNKCIKMEILKLSKQLLYIIGLYDRNTTELIFVLIKYFSVTFFLLVVMVTSSLFVVSNLSDFELAARALLPTFALLTSCTSYWILIVQKHGIRTVLQGFESLVNDSKYFIIPFFFFQLPKWKIPTDCIRILRTATSSILRQFAFCTQLYHLLDNFVTGIHENKDWSNIYELTEAKYTRICGVFFRYFFCFYPIIVLLLALSPLLFWITGQDQQWPFLFPAM